MSKPWQTSCRGSRAQRAFTLAELLGGGAERSMLSIIESVDRARIAPALILFDERLDHAPPDDVPIVVLAGSAPRGLGGSEPPQGYERGA